MYSHDDFVRDVTRNFEFLESGYGMRREPVHLADGGCWVVYAGPAVKVVIEHELGGYCGVTVQNLPYVKRDPMERSEFDLEEIVAIASPRQPRRQDPRSMSEAVVKAAQTLRSTGDSVLRGDFEPLHSRQRKLIEAARRLSPLAPG